MTEPDADDLMPIVVGQRWNGPVPLPPGDSFGCHFTPGMPNLLLLAWDPPYAPFEPLMDATTTRVGLVEFGRLVIVLLKVGPQVLESPSPYLLGSDPPEVSWDPEHPTREHMAWTLVIVQAGVVARMRMFTTGPRFSVALRRMLAAQRAAGPMTEDEADVEIARWRAACPTVEAAWERCEVTSKAGD